MAIKISDFDAVARLTDAELADGMGEHNSPAWRAEYCRYRQQLEQRWPEILTQYREWRQRNVADDERRAAKGLPPFSQWDSVNEPTGIVIYGLTGSTRWFVRGNGEIVFSVYHCPPDCDLGRRKLATAQALDFNLG